MNDFLGSSSLGNAFVEIAESSDVKLTNLQMTYCNMQTSRVINVLSSSRINLTEITINETRADFNNLIYLSQTRDLYISNINVARVLSNSPSKWSHHLTS